MAPPPAPKPKPAVKSGQARCKQLSFTPTPTLGRGVKRGCVLKISTDFCFVSLPLVPKPVFSSELQDKQVKEGDNLTLDVRVPIECKAEVTWYKDDHALKEDHHIAIISAGEMQAVNIFDVSVKDEAVYRCVAANDAGSVSTDCEVLVEGILSMLLAV